MFKRKLMIGIFGVMVSAVGGTLFSVCAEAVELKLNGEYAQKYDDNITYADRDPSADFISVLSAGMNFSGRSRRSSGEINAELSRELFWEYTGNNSVSGAVALKMNYDISRAAQIAVHNDFTRGYLPRTIDDEFERGSGRYRYLDNRFEAEYSRALNSRNSITVGYGYDVYQSAREYSPDSTQQRIFTEALHAFSSERIIFGRYEWLERMYDPRATVNIKSINSGIRQSLTGQTSVELRAGMDLIDPPEGRIYSEPSWSIRITDQFNAQSALTLDSSQRFSVNSYTDEVIDTWRMSGNLNSQLFRQLSGSTSVFYGRGKFTESDIIDRYFGCEIAVGYDVSDNLRAQLSYSYSETASNQNSREYRKNVVFFGLRMLQ